MKMIRIREKVRGSTWGQPACELLRRELDSLPEQALGIPHEPGGWWHQYVCPEHHTELLFDPAETDALSYECPYGCRLTGEPYRGAWLVFKHQALARYALQAAAVYAGTGEESYARIGWKLILGYAAQFPHYPVHPDAQPWMLKGRAFHQALTEAIWATTLIRGYLLLRDEGAAVSLDEAGARAMETFLDLLESSMEQYRHVLIHEKRNPENNYTAWLNAALSCVYAARGEKEKLLTLVDGEGGLLHHLTIGVKPDQFEFEGSTYYHIFVLRAYLIAAEMAERLGVDLYTVRGADGQSFEGMLDVLAGLSNDFGELPALHDGPYARVPFAREIAEVFETGLTRYGHARYIPILAEAYRQLYGEPVRTGLEALLYGTGDWALTSHCAEQGAGAVAEGGGRSELSFVDDYRQRRSLLLPDSGFVVLRRPGSKLSALADFGPHGGSHGHYDKLHLSLMHERGAVAPDMGVVPYGSPLRKGWYAETASHNTVSIGKQSQAPHEGACIQYEERPDGTYVWLRSDQAYADTVFDRHLLLTGEWLLDWFEVQTRESAQIDWWMHGIGDMAPADSPEAWEDSYEVAEGAEAAAMGSGGGYGHIRPVRSRKPIIPGQETCLWRMTVDGTAAQVTAAMVLFPGSEAKQVRTPGVSVDPSRPAGVLLHRQQGRTARFIAVYRDGTEPLSLHFSEGTDRDAALDIVTGSGVRRSVHFTKQAGLRLVELSREV